MFLDTLPYNAVSTAYHALHAGLPLVTCLGQTFVGRTAATMLVAAGLPELITASPAEYERTALRLARSPEFLRDIRQRLRRARSTSPLFDPGRLARDSEAAYLRMWDIWRAGEQPKPFSLAAS